MWEDYTKVTIAKKTGSHMWVRRSGCMVQVDYSGSSTRYRIKDGSSWYNVLECDEYGYSYKFNNNGWWYFNM